MKFQIGTFFSLILASSNAFAPSSIAPATVRTSGLRMSTIDEVARLRQAAAQAREEAARLAKVWNEKNGIRVARL